jgi:lipoprotein-anchoring transpeptidase ErfK/SrfK
MPWCAAPAPLPSLLVVDRRAMVLLAMASVALPACSSSVQSEGRTTTDPRPTAVVVTTSEPPPTTVPPTLPPTSSTSSTTSTTASTTSTSTTSTSTTTTTTTVPLDVYDPACVVKVRPDDTLIAIAGRLADGTVDPETIKAENALDGNQINLGQLLDVCVDNGINDITGEARGERNPVIVAREVMAQQTKLNELFAGYGIRELLVDGVSGPVTRQRLCAFRLAAGLPVSTANMAGGSEEEQLLMAATALPIPFTSAILAERWVLIDRTCQIMFVGEGTSRLTFVFPTSTGMAEFPTRDQTRSRVFKYDPAANNGGWHDSLSYPAAEDNPLNGNMYKPLYFDNGQAIHGANNVPTSPQSHGCARLRVEHMNMLLAWLGLADVNSPIHSTNRINLAVNVQGAWQG